MGFTKDLSETIKKNNNVTVPIIFHLQELATSKKPGEKYIFKYFKLV
jgi:hypothetical protein